MDAEHRHELHQNDLAEFMAHFGEWWSKHGLRTLLIVFVAVGAVFLFRLHRTSEQRAHDQVWNDLAQATSAAQYRGVARSHDNPTIQALAYLRAGDLELRKAIAPVEKPAEDDEPADDPTERRKKLLDAAEQDYNAVIDNPAAHTAIRLNALLGLASVAESRLSWDEAKEIYQQIQDQASEGYEGIENIALRRVGALERAAIPVVFAPDPPPPPDLPPDSSLDSPLDLPPDLIQSLIPAEGPDAIGETPAEPETKPQPTPETSDDSAPADSAPAPADTP